MRHANNKCHSVQIRLNLCRFAYAERMFAFNGPSNKDVIVAVLRYATPLNLIRLNDILRRYITLN